MDAYVCLGTKLKNLKHAWVVTLSKDYSDVIFWESLTGNRYIHLYINPNEPPLDKNLVINHPYKTIGCLFNHKFFYANIQILPNVDTCIFNLRDQSKWKAISQDAILTVSKQLSMPPLCQNQLDSSLLSDDLEKELKKHISLYRKDIGLTTFWDENLSFILSPALSSYEYERVTGLSVGNEEFDQAIKLAIPDGHSFKAYPIQLASIDPNKAMQILLKSEICQEIIKSKGDQIKLAIRSKIFIYPESTIATWLILAVRLISSV